MKILDKIDKLAIKVEQEIGKKVKAVRVFTNCLCLYLENGATRFYSKMNQAWGKTGNVYFVTKNFSKDTLPKSLRREFKSLIEWTQYWVEGTASKLWLTLEYNIKYKK